MKTNEIIIIDTIMKLQGIAMELQNKKTISNELLKMAENLEKML